MTTLLTRLLSDEAGFIISAELILVGTIAKRPQGRGTVRSRPECQQ